VADRDVELLSMHLVEEVDKQPLLAAEPRCGEIDVKDSQPSESLNGLTQIVAVLLAAVLTVRELGFRFNWSELVRVRARP
jgi:hypothetical protein